MCRLCTIHIKVRKHGFFAKLAETNIRREDLGKRASRASGKRLTPEEWLWLEQNYIGKVIDREVAKMAGEKFSKVITKSAVERYRHKRGIKPYVIPGQVPKKTPVKEKQLSEAKRRGYESTVVEKLWLENRFIEDLLYTWKRTPELRRHINNLDRWFRAKRIWRYE
jgi:hypothetical protein